ncbi:hypothetical protein HLB42_20800 (plasmid) [Deinococcus sp. D7000]|nr:hypothetical protein HLB42_20800 [Deinococcus sp. D7000]
MALFGDLQHHALTDLAKVLQARTGTLVFRSALQGRTLELVLKTGQLRALYVDGVPTLDLPGARDVLQQLHAQGHGAFEFRMQNLVQSDVHFYDEALTTLVSEIVTPGVTDHLLPHPETRFLRTLKPVQVPATLMPLWTRIKPHLASGRSAAELAVRLDLPQQELLLALARLRALDLITPQRAAAPSTASTAHPAAGPQSQGLFTVNDLAPVTVAPASPAPRPLVQRLLGALRRFTQGGTA